MTGKSASRAVHADHESATSAARSLLPALRNRAEEAEALRTVPEESIDDIRRKGLFHLCAPREFGGSQLGITTFLATTAEIASGCGSTGWVYAVLAGHNWTLSLLPVEAQREVFADAGALVASVIHLNSKPPKPVEGGFLIEDAHGRFCSGVDYAKWILVGSQVAAANDRAQPYYFLIPKDEFTIKDDWFAVGLRGTGSKSVKATRIFVPEHRSCSLAAVADASAPGIVYHDSPVYRMPLRETQRLQLLGAPLGIARAALAHCIDAYKAHHGTPGLERLEESRAAFLRLARASAALDAATGLVLDDARAFDSRESGSDASGSLSGLDRARCLRNIAYAAQECRHVVTALFEASGARGLLDENVMQRLWRDANAAAAHVAFVRDKVDLPYGRALCGLE